MAEPLIDLGLGAIILAIIGLVLWILTNLHFWRRTGRAVIEIKADIDQKRAKTQDFVVDQLETLENALSGRLSALEGKIGSELGGLEARMHAEIPPNVHGELTDLRGELTELAKMIGSSFRDLPERIRLTGASILGVETREINRLAEGVQDELKIVNAAIPNVVPSADPRAAILKAITRPTAAKFAKDNPLAALIVDTGKAKLAEWLSGGELRSGATQNASFRMINSTSGGSSDM